MWAELFAIDFDPSCHLFETGLDHFLLEPIRITMYYPWIHFDSNSHLHLICQRVPLILGSCDQQSPFSTDDYHWQSARAAWCWRRGLGLLIGSGLHFWMIWQHFRFVYHLEMYLPGRQWFTVGCLFGWVTHYQQPLAQVHYHSTSYQPYYCSVVAKNSDCYLSDPHQLSHFQGSCFGWGEFLAPSC